MEKKKIVWWLELVRAIIAALAGATSGFLV
jgi:hypothetical protein